MNRTDYLIRLRRIEGQIRGLQKMIKNDECCVDVLTQVSAVTAALRGVAIGLVEDHLRQCTLEASSASRTDRKDKLDEAMRAVERLVRI